MTMTNDDDDSDKCYMDDDDDDDVKCYRDDGEEFAAVRAAMKVLEMTDQEIWDILKV